MINDSSQDFVLLNTENLYLVVSRKQFSDISHISNRDHANNNVLRSSAEMLSCAASETEIYGSLSDKLAILPSIPDNHFVYTSFLFAPSVLWCWKDVQLIGKKQFNLSPIPSILISDSTPVSKIAVLENNVIAFVADGEMLWQFIIDKDNNLI